MQIKPIKAFLEAVRSVHSHVVRETPTLRKGAVGATNPVARLLGMRVTTVERFREAAELETREEQLCRLVEQLHKEARTDSLTGLPNRLAFVTALEERINETLSSNMALETAVIFIDLDGFKQVNDDLGHATGDDALKEAARRLEGVFKREGDIIMPMSDGKEVIGRIGGDEIALLLPADGPDRSFDEEAIYKMIRAAFDGLVFWKDNTPYPIGASIGFVSFDREFLSHMTGDSQNKTLTILHAADQAMYEDKKDKGNRQTKASMHALASRFHSGAEGQDHTIN